MTVQESHPGAVTSRSRRTDTGCDTVVVGAGLSGLAAARSLAEAGQHVIVLEARDRVGGRTFDATMPGLAVTAPPTEMGGQFVGHDHVRLRRLLDAFDLRTFPTFETGRHLLELHGRRTDYRGPLPRLAPWRLAEAAVLHQTIERCARRLPMGRPWLAPPEDDRITVEDWLRRRHASATGRTFLRLVVQGLLGAEPEQVSMLHLLHYVRSNGGLLRLAKTRGGAQQDRVAGGTQQISERLATRLGPEAVRLAHPVSRIEWSARDVDVVTSRGVRVHATAAVIAVPPGPARHLTFAPILPEARRRLIAAVPHGDVIKVAVGYDEPWWRRRGLSGQSVSDRSLAPVVFDNTPPAGAPGILMILVGGARAQALRKLPPEQRRGVVVDALVDGFGPRAAQVSAYREQDWTTDPWTQGCYGAFMPPGVWTSYGHALREPVGPLHWAGTETAREAAGYMEGAVESGYRAAAEVLAMVAVRR